MKIKANKVTKMRSQKCYPPIFIMVALAWHHGSVSTWQHLNKNHTVGLPQWKQNAWRKVIRCKSSMVAYKPEKYFPSFDSYKTG